MARSAFALPATAERLLQQAEIGSAGSVEHHRLAIEDEAASVEDEAASAAIEGKRCVQSWPPR
ncbi:hypothetical protein BLM15_30865 (plasmid) [Bosea sp. Tri-49]|nr:hypothetical protein BLM15_30865 [Bosea sp. Tri-49]